MDITTNFENAFKVFKGLSLTENAVIGGVVVLCSLQYGENPLFVSNSSYESARIRYIKGACTTPVVNDELTLSTGTWRVIHIDHSNSVFEVLTIRKDERGKL